MGIRRPPSRGQCTGRQAPPKRAIAQSPRAPSHGGTSAPGKTHSSSQYHQTQHWEPSGLSPVRQQPRDGAAPPKPLAPGARAGSVCPQPPHSQPTLTGERAVRATVHHHQYAYRLPSAPPLQPICDHTWLRRRGSCRGGGGGGGEDPPAPSQHGHAAQPGAGAVPL